MPPLLANLTSKFFDEALQNQYIISGEWFLEYPIPSTKFTS